MQALVRIALQRPYTFVVLALLILSGGSLSALRTPTDIFPNIGIPVISVVWQYTGLPPDQMTLGGRTAPGVAGDRLLAAANPAAALPMK